jgi:tetratricopeptide (TPR) repeat protein
MLTCAILIFAGILMSLGREPLEKITERSNLTMIFTYLDLYKPRDVKVVFLGSSRFVSCIRSDVFAGLSSVDQSKALNLASEGGGTWEELLMCRKYPGLLDAAPVVVIEIEPWMFNRNQVHPIYKSLHPFEPHFYTWATFQERLEYPDMKMKTLLLADYVWPFSERRSLKDWASAFRIVLEMQEPEPHLSIPVYHYDPVSYQKLASNPDFTAHQMVRYQLNDYELALHKAEYLKRLIDLLQKKTKRIVLLQPPVRAEYIDAIYDNPKYLDTYMQVLKFIHSLENENVHSIIWETPKDCGLDDAVFIDYGHFNAKGAYIFTQRLWSELKALGLVSPNGVEGTQGALLKESILKLEADLKTDPKDYEALYKLGNLSFRANPARAMECYQAALSIRPDSMGAMERLAMLYSGKGDLDGALKLLDRMKAQQPENPDIYYNLACIKARQNRIDESVGLLETAIGKGFSNRHLLVLDKDLDNIKGSPEFRELLK